VILPSEECPVWIRRLAWYDVPVRGSFILPDQFQVIVDHDVPGGDLVYLTFTPHQIHTWKYQYLADQPE